MTPRVSVIAAVRERTQMLNAMLESLKATAHTDVEVILRCDRDDDQMISYLRMREWDHPVIFGPRLKGYASCGVFLNQAARLSRGELILVVNDDVVFETPGWDEILLEEASKFPDGIFLLGVHTLNEGNFPFTCVSREFVEAVGFIVDERLVYTDVWARDVLARVGRTQLVPQVSIRHDWQGMSQDQTVAQRTTCEPGYVSAYEEYVDEAVKKIRIAMGVYEMEELQNRAFQCRLALLNEEHL